MSYDGDSLEHEIELEDNNYEIIKLLRRVVGLLEIIADMDEGESEVFEE